mgnify:CR=1 FL=1
MDEDAEDVVLMLQVVGVHLVSRDQFGQEELSDMNEILDHLVLVEMGLRDGLLYLLEQAEEVGHLVLIKMEHRHGGEDFHIHRIPELLVQAEYCVEVVLLYHQVDRDHILGACVEEIADIWQGDKEIVLLQFHLMIVVQILLPPVDDEHDGIETRCGARCLHAPECPVVYGHTGHSSSVYGWYRVVCGEFLQIIDVWVDHKFFELDCKDKQLFPNLQILVLFL